MEDVLKEAWWVSLRDGEFREEEKRLVEALLKQHETERENEALEEVGRFIGTKLSALRQTFLREWMDCLGSWWVPFCLTRVWRWCGEQLVWPFLHEENEADRLTADELRECCRPRKLKDPLRRIRSFGM
uniref:Uncharacterized protein n=1 Tax=Chromera velia CCMP2878 TaxID=1169474 RepID=A0A0G4F7K4_9ALVE|mmetsp:Transcript_19996/g.40188  ORF Transcript_19996/g.40188 Transcript_19996/m.40188 type:complete len:129 (+) Transcript_19996:332-718(+)|eukprot:Cvel_15562.t1-p1 / transcript=Cvel_15562.t1 / gene=Cvel_15562 / organism=Chromera_velia_CCMP2878 / gene_product=hypothetical protein / transcript_product=hypothetical protein / location=Cvel_scaffold1157:7804-8287(+) / protein_length=128 / sequence_SO=supercontig / SO=protein_coding / is_pseudo=false